MIRTAEVALKTMKPASVYVLRLLWVCWQPLLYRHRMTRTLNGQPSRGSKAFMLRQEQPRTSQTRDSVPTSLRRTPN
jgi:hypothetical protein